MHIDDMGQGWGRAGGGGVDMRKGSVRTESSFKARPKKNVGGSEQFLSVREGSK